MFCRIPSKFPLGILECISSAGLQIYNKHSARQNNFFQNKDNPQLVDIVTLWRKLSQALSQRTVTWARFRISSERRKAQEKVNFPHRIIVQFCAFPKNYGNAFKCRHFCRTFRSKYLILFLPFICENILKVDSLGYFY